MFSNPWLLVLTQGFQLQLLEKVRVAQLRLIERSGLTLNAYSGLSLAVKFNKLRVTQYLLFEV